MQVGPQVVDPELLRPRLFLRGLAVEEQHVRLHALCVEDARGQAEQRVNVGLLEQLATDGFPGAAFEEHVVRQHHRRAAVLLEDGEDMLEEVELLVARARPEVVAIEGERLLRRLARLVDDGDAALFPEGRIGQDDLVLAVLSGQCVLGGHRQVRIRLAADAVEQQVHRAEAGDAVHQLDAEERAVPELLLLFPVERVGAGEVVVGREQEPAGATRRITDRLAWLRGDGIHHRGDERARGEVLAGTALHVLGVLLEQPFVGVSLHVGGQARPLLLIDQVHDEPAQLGRVLDLVLRLAEDDAEHARPLAEIFQRVAVKDFQVVAVCAQQRRPILALGNGRRPVERRTRLLIRHLEEQQKRQLLDVVPIGQAVIPQDVAVVPKLLDEGGGVAHISTKTNNERNGTRHEYSEKKTGLSIRPDKTPRKPVREHRNTDRCFRS